MPTNIWTKYFVFLTLSIAIMFWESGDTAHRRGHGRVWSKVWSCCHKSLSSPGPRDQSRLWPDECPLRDAAPAPDVAAAADPLLSTDLHIGHYHKSQSHKCWKCLCKENVWLHFVLSCRSAPRWLTACVVDIVTVTRDVTLWAVSGGIVISWLLTVTIWGQTHNVMSALQLHNDQSEAENSLIWPMGTLSVRMMRLTPDVSADFPWLQIWDTRKVRGVTSGESKDTWAEMGKIKNIFVSFMFNRMQNTIRRPGTWHW